MQLMQKLASVQWSWAAGDVPRLMRDLGAELVEDVGERLTYRSAEGPHIDIYLYKRTIVAVEALLDLFMDADELEPDEYEAKLDEFRVKFEDTVAACATVLGPPSFHGPYDSDGYPDDQDALLLALWPVENGRLMVQLKHEGMDVPIRLVLAAAPVEEAD